jgi:hypothetical protein
MHRQKISITLDEKLDNTMLYKGLFNNNKKNSNFFVFFPSNISFGCIHVLVTDTCGNYRYFNKMSRRCKDQSEDVKHDEMKRNRREHVF